jgi:hypothetical protein
MNNMTHVLKVLTLFVLAASLLGDVSADPCVIPSTYVGLEKRVFASVDTLMACFNSIPADQSRISYTISVLRQLVDLYSFTDVLKADLAPWHMTIDLNARLDEISKKNYNNDYDFHSDLNRLFNSLNDAHTMYYPPYPYSICYGFKPFMLSASVENGTTIVRLVQNKLLSTLGLTGYFDWPYTVSTYYSAQVLEINGQNPSDYLKNYSNHVGTYKDPQVRFNSLFGEYGWGLVNPFTFQFQDIEAENFTVETWKFGNVTQLNIPIISVCQPVFTGLDTVVTLLNTPIVPKKGKRYTEEETPSVVQPDIHQEIRERVHEIKVKTEESTNQEQEKKISAEEREAKIHEQLREMVAGGCTSALYDWALDNSIEFHAYCDEENNIVPILKVSTFAPKEFRDFIEVLSVYKSVIAAYKWDYIVVDVSGNGGGVLCFSMLLQGLLSQELAHTSLEGELLWRPFNLRKSELMTSFYTSNDVYEMDADYMNITTGAIESPENFYQKTVEVQYGSVKSQVTEFIYFPASCKNMVLDNNFPRVNWWPKNVIVLTDGTCGSACAQFISKMTQNNRALVVALGGYLNNSSDVMRTGSFPGGNVVELPGSAQSILPNLDTFKTSAKARFNMHQSFNSLSSNLPLEFDYDAFTPNVTMKYWQASTSLEVVLGATKLWPNFTQPYVLLPPIADTNPFNITITPPPPHPFHPTWKFWVIVGAIGGVAVLIPAIIIIVKRRNRRNNPEYQRLINPTV